MKSAYPKIFEPITIKRTTVSYTHLTLPTN